MTDESWYIVVDHTLCPNYKSGRCTVYEDDTPRECCREECILCIIEKKDLLKENMRED